MAPANRNHHYWPRLSRAAIAGLAATLAYVAMASGSLAAQCKRSANVWKIDGLKQNFSRKQRKNLSGLACAPMQQGMQRCLIVQDEGFRAAWGEMTPGRLKLTASFNLPDYAPLSGSGEMDAEAAAWSQEKFYVLGSHSTKDKRCASNASSEVLLRFAFGPGKPRLERSRSLLELLAQIPELKSSIHGCLGSPEARKKKWQKAKAHGLNIEGMAIAGSDAVFGLRGPVVNRRAALVRVGLDSLFGNASAKPHISLLPLQPPGGVRDLATLDSTGAQILILSGAEDDATGRAAIHLWDGKASTAAKLCDLPDPPKGSKKKPEALFVTARDGKIIRLLVISDGIRDGEPEEYEFALP
ncbi:MAG: DUF3616 domain-containing protein [Beijerinckiaceae bacterium]